MAPADDPPGPDEAAEYVLGTLDASERAEFEARLVRDEALAADVAAWERRLSALNEQTRPVEPSARVSARLFARIDGLGLDNVVQLKRRVAQWQGIALAVSALAACLILFVAVRAEWTVAPSGVYVAVLQGSENAPGFIATVDVASNVVVVRRMGAQAPEGRSYELWALGAGRASPEALGVIGAAARIPAARLGMLDERSLAATVFAVSLEPAGGSPTGQPTGPVVFTGKLLLAG